MAMTQGATATNSVEQAAIQEFGQRLVQLRDDLSNNLDRMERIAGRAFGMSPPNASTGEKLQALPTGELAAVGERIDGLFNLAVLQSSVINRLEKIV